MKKNNVRASLSAGLALLAGTLPTTAFAESGTETGMKLLLPNMGEFIPACIAFLVIWFVLAKFAWPMILGMMDEREKKIADDIEGAQKAREEAEEGARAVSDKLDEARREADEIVAKARREAEKQRAQILATAQDEAADIVAKAHETVESERKKAMIELSESVVDLSVDIAGKIIGDGMDESAQRTLAQKYLAEVGSLNE